MFIQMKHACVHSVLGPKILASGSRDRLIHVFDVEQRYGLLQTLDDHSAAIQSVRFTDANNKLRMLSCGSDKSLLFRNAALVSWLNLLANLMGYCGGHLQRQKILG